MWRSRQRVALVLALVLATACGTDADEAVEGSTTSTTSTTSITSTTSGDAVLAVEVERSRLFEQQRSLGVTVRNETDRAVVVDDVRFTAGPYDAVPATDRTVTVPADGGRVSFPVPFGPARCDSTDDVIEVRFRLDGASATRQAPVSNQVRRAHARECATAAVRRAVRIDFAPDWEVVGSRRVQGSLVVDPLDGHDAEVTDVVTSIVFVTEVTDRSAAGPSLEVVAGRCDTHALIESKKTFTFVVSVAVDGAEPVPVEVVPAEGPARTALQQAIEDCLDASPAA